MQAALENEVLDHSPSAQMAMLEVDAWQQSQPPGPPQPPDFNDYAAPGQGDWGGAPRAHRSVAVAVERLFGLAAKAARRRLNEDTVGVFHAHATNAPKY